MKRITDNYGNYLKREINQYTKLRDRAIAWGYERDVIATLERELNEAQTLLNAHTEVSP